MGKRRKQDDPDYVDPKKMIALEEEMAALKKEYGIEDKPRWWVSRCPYSEKNISFWPCVWAGPAVIGFIRSSMPWVLSICCFAGPEFRLQ